MARRMFYVDEIRSGRAVLSGETVQHLRKVLRAEPGQQFEISDNESLYLAELSSYGKDLAEFTVVSEIDSPRAPLRLHLLPALIKFDRFEWILEKATETRVDHHACLYHRSDQGLDQPAPKLGRWRKSTTNRAKAPVPCAGSAPPVRHAMPGCGSLAGLCLMRPRRPPILARSCVRAGTDIAALRLA